MICYTDVSENDVYVADVCPNNNVCWLNGCGDIVMDIIKAYIAPVLAVVFILSVFAYIYGCVYTVQLTMAVSVLISKLFYVKLNPASVLYNRRYSELEVGKN